MCLVESAASPTSSSSSVSDIVPSLIDSGSPCNQRFTIRQQKSGAEQCSTEACMHALEVKGFAPATMSTETQQHCPAVCGVVPHTMPVSLMVQVVHTLRVHKVLLLVAGQKPLDGRSCFK